MPAVFEDFLRATANSRFFESSDTWTLRLMLNPDPAKSSAEATTFVSDLWIAVDSAARIFAISMIAAVGLQCHNPTRYSPGMSRMGIGTGHSTNPNPRCYALTHCQSKSTACSVAGHHRRHVTQCGAQQSVH